MARRRVLPALGLLLAAFLVPGAAAAQGLAGPYLAAIEADARNDYAAAARFYPKALVADPGNPRLLRGTLTSFVAKGDVTGAAAIARRILEIAPHDQFAGLVLVADALHLEDYPKAEELLRNENVQMNELLRSLLLGWTLMAEGRATAAQERFGSMIGDRELSVLAKYNKALALAMAGDFEGANRIMEGEGDEPIRFDRNSLIAHIQILAQIDRRDKAIAYIDEAVAGRTMDSELAALRERLASGKEIPFDAISGPRDAIANVVLTLAGALSQDDDQRIALIYARLAEHIRPGSAEALLMAADVLENQGQHDLAIETYSRVPVSSPRFVDAEIGRADALRAAGRADAGIEVLAGLAKSNPDNLAVQVALGDALRSAERFAEAAKAYGDAIALVDTPGANHWSLFYSRGVSYERTGEWDKAEADLRFALELSPDQPLVLNYLGYSLVELRRDLAEAEDMIRRAVKARPNDGYIADSLGWVLYRLGRYDEAVPPMERSVELVPNDPIINDHLGDVLWMVGRKREAEFQWRRALSFEPEDKEATRIRRKLDIGLDKVLEEEAAAGGNDARNE
ncbi:MAG: tetratricopeptide repeat protein [Paracoccaceae bacterium]